MKRIVSARLSSRIFIVVAAASLTACQGAPRSASGDGWDLPAREAAADADRLQKQQAERERKELALDTSTPRARFPSTAASSGTGGESPPVFPTGASGLGLHGVGSGGGGLGHIGAKGRGPGVTGYGAHGADVVARPRRAPPSAGGTFASLAPSSFVDTRDDRFSTFAADVDTASFDFARPFLDSGTPPPPDSVRVEEWVNALHYGYAPPSSSNGPFAVHVAGAPSPFHVDMQVVRVAVQAARVSRATRKPTALVFLVDVSGSMDQPDKLPLARASLHRLVATLRDDDRIALVTYAGETRVALPSTSARERRIIDAAIDTLRPGGGTDMGSGLELAMQQANASLGDGGSARVIVLSDGDVNIGRTSHESILHAVRGYVSEGVTLSTVGFGNGNYNDHLMEQLADAGNGNASYIDSPATAQRVFVDDLDSMLEVVAQDVKLQVEWNPDVVARYRLIGYENRDVADEDFRNDKKDAGEIGAGHAVTALYEIALRDDDAARHSDELGVVRVRHKQPRGTRAEERAHAFSGAVLTSTKALDLDGRAAFGAALAAEILRGNPAVAHRSVDDAIALLRSSAEGKHAQERRALADSLARLRPRFAMR